MTRPWKLILLLLGIFIAGAVSGAFVTMQIGRDSVPKPENGPDQWVPHHLKKLVERLELTPAQVEELRPIVRKNMEELFRLRTDSWNSTKEMFERMQREVAEKLTPEQRIKYEQLNKEMRERAKKAMPERSKGPRPQPSEGAPSDKAPAGMLPRPPN